MRSLGLTILIIGSMVLFIGLFTSLSETERVVEGVSGHRSYLIEYFVGALILLVGGALLLMSKGEPKS